MYLIAIILIFTLSLKAQTFFISPSLPIPGASTVFADLTVSGIASIIDTSFGLENCCIDITHPQTDDLTIWIISPNGTEILLSAENGGSGDNYTNTCFDGNQSYPLITSGSAPFTGNFLPEQSLGFLNSGIIDPNGIWRLKITDDFFFRSGTLNSFSLTFGNDPALVQSSTNDDCSTAINLNVNNNFTCTLINPSWISNASTSNEPDSCNFTNAPFDDDIWFTFTATSNIHEFLINNIIGSSTEIIFQVLSGICGNTVPVYCYENNDHNFTINNLVIGNQYFLRLASKTISSSQIISFDICIKLGVPPPPLNDECVNAFSIPSGGYGCTGVTGTVNGATSSGDLFSCNVSGSFDNDIWFSFVATQGTHFIYISDIEGTAPDLDYILSHGTCGSLVQDSCFNDPISGDGFIIPANNLNIGNTYFLRVATYQPQPQNTSFKVCLGIPPAPPSNDNCAGAIELPQLSNDCNIINATIAGATGQQGFNCNVSFQDYFDDDVWFKFTPTSSSHVIDIFNIQGTTHDLVYEVLSGSCSNLNPVLCQDNPNDSILLNGLTLNTDYYIRVASYLNLIEHTDFEIRIRHNNLIVCNDQPSGPGTFREAVENANPLDTIKLDGSLNNTPLFLDAPNLVIDKPIIFHNNNGNNITLKNLDSGFNEVILSIQNQFSIKGLIMEVTNPETFKIKVENGGTLIIY